MCRVFVIIMLGAFALGSVFTTLAQNHNAVLITGDTPGLRGAGGPKNWDGGGRPPLYDEFWNDTYLMWELLWENAKYELYGTAPQNDHIHVLYGDGADYSEELRGERYDPEIQISPGLHITDYGGYYQDVANIFDWLAHGGAGIDSMTAQDNLFCWTGNHGDTSEGHSSLGLMDGEILDYDFANRVGEITCNHRFFLDAAMLLRGIY